MRKTPIACLLTLACLAHGTPGSAQPGEAYGQWVEKAHADWPSIAMINRIDYTDESFPVAGCAFLLDTGDATLAATAKHVLRFFKSETMDSVSFRGTLKSWRVFPKDDPSRVTVLGELVNEDDEASLESIPVGRDWLLFTVRKRAESVQALRLRSTPLVADEPVFIVGWRYTDEGSQKIYAGNYVRSEEGSVLIAVDALADNKMPGLSGAPVIDARGYVIGVMSQKAGTMQRLASIDYPQALLEDVRLEVSTRPDRRLRSGP